MPDLNSERARWLASLTKDSPVVLRHQTGFQEPAKVVGIREQRNTEVIVIATATEEISFVRDTGNPFSERSYRSISPVTPEFLATWQQRQNILSAPGRSAWLTTLSEKTQVVLHLPSGVSLEVVGRCDANHVRVSGHGSPNFYFLNRLTGTWGSAEQIWISPATPEIAAALLDKEAREETLSRVKLKFGTWSPLLSTGQLSMIEDIIDTAAEQRTAAIQQEAPLA